MYITWPQLLISFSSKETALNFEKSSKKESLNWLLPHAQKMFAHTPKLTMISNSSKLQYCVQQTTKERDVGHRIYYFVLHEQPTVLEVPL